MAVGRAPVSGALSSRSSSEARRGAAGIVPLGENGRRICGPVGIGSSRLCHGGKGAAAGAPLMCALAARRLPPWLSEAAASARSSPPSLAPPPRIPSLYHTHTPQTSPRASRTRSTPPRCPARKQQRLSPRKRNRKNLSNAPFPTARCSSPPSPPPPRPSARRPRAARPCACSPWWSPAPARRRRTSSG